MLKKQRELCTNSPLPALIRIDTDVMRKIHFQQDCFGCVDDEANIVNKCDARRQVVSGNEMFSLSKEWDGSISVLTAVYGAIVLFWHESQAMHIFKSELAYLVRQAEVLQAIPTSMLSCDDRCIPRGRPTASAGRRTRRGGAHQAR